ncbi:MAG: CPBP family intramembrane glutamic endopeptidase, partial [Anaerolineae bacterium]
AIPNLMQRLEKTAADNLPPGKRLPPRRVIVSATLAQSLLLVAATSALGTALAPRVGLAAPFFESLAAGQPIWATLAPQVLPALVLGVGGALAIVAAYYLFFRPRLDQQTVGSMEALRLDLGLRARVLYGGIVEEVLFRWGVMTLLVWLGAALFGGPTSALMWAVIAVSGVLFGLGHLPSYRLAGCQVTPLFLGLMITLNLWATLICGWLFWQYGLLAAMIAHMLYHMVWLPFDLHYGKEATASQWNESSKSLGIGPGQKVTGI